MLKRFTVVAMVIAAFASSIYAQDSKKPAPARMTGRVADSKDAGVSGATVVLTKPQSGEIVAIVTADNNGQYAFSATPPGEYMIQAFAVGFGASRLLPVGLQSEGDSKKNILMDIEFARNDRNLPSRTAPATASATSASNAMLVSAEEMQKKLIRETPPIPPPGVKPYSVVFSALIDPNGRVVSANVIGNADPAIKAAALEALSTWVYRPTVVNGKPMSVQTTVMVRFK